MEIASKNACVLLDGDLQDPPELIEQFVAHWREGYDVVYGRRVKREATLFMQFAYKAFYRVFDYFSYIRDPARRRRLLADGQARRRRRSCSSPSATCSSAASAPSPASSRPGSITSGPSGCSGVTTNNLLKNIGWAKKGILSFSNTPLNMHELRRHRACSGLSIVLAIGPGHRLGCSSRRSPPRASRRPCC